MNIHLSTGWTIALAAIVVWDLIWRGIALWQSSRRREIGWFVALLVFNTASVLPLLYLVIHDLNERSYNSRRQLI
jgi:hypothetical protein